MVGLVLAAAVGTALLGPGLAPAASTTAAAAATGALAAAPATGALPSYFDGCAYFTPDDVREVTGVTVQRRTDGAPGPQDAAAAACTYAGVGAELSVSMTIWTKTSADEAGLDFGDLAGFTGDYPVDLSAKTPAAGVGDEAWYAPQSDGGLERALLARHGEVRLLLLGAGPSVDATDGLGRIASRILAHLDDNPPPPDPLPVAGSLKPIVPRYQFGNGRALFVDPNGTTASLRALVGTKITGRRVFFNGDVPDELDLRALSVVDVAGTTTAVLQFASPLTTRTTFSDAPVEHRIMVVLRSPTGDTLGVAIGPDGKGVALRDPLGTATATGPAAVLFSGNWAVLDIPASFGVTSDWSVQAVVRIDAPGGFPYGRTLTGWQLTTVPVTVGSLRGDKASVISLPADGASVPVLPSAAALGDDRSTTLAPIAIPAQMAARSVALDTAGGHRRLVVTFAAPPVGGGTFAGTNDPRVSITINLAPTGPLSPGAPVELIWTLPAAGKTADPATVRGQAGGSLGVVPVTVSGETARFDLDAYAPNAPSTPATTTTVPSAQPHGTLGVDTIRFREEVLLGADGCICPDGQPAPTATASERDVLEIQLAGPALTITRHSNGSTAVGAIDSRTGQFVASNATEHWSGTLTTNGGMIGRYAHLVTSAQGNGLAFQATDPSNPFGFLNPLNGINNQANRPGGGTPASPNDPCWKIINQTVYIGRGRMLVFQGGVPRTILPPTALGFDQNAFASTWDYQQWLNSQRWPDGGCNQSASTTTGQRNGTLLADRPAANPAVAASPILAATNPGPLPGLTDLTDTWSLSLDLAISDSTTGNVLARQTTPSVQLRLLGALAPTTSTTSGSTPTTSTAGSQPATTVAASTTSTSHGSSSSTGWVVAIVVLVLAVVGAAFVTVRTRRRRRT